MKLETNRLTIVPCTQELVNNMNCHQYNVGPHIHSYLEQLEADSALLGWGVWLVVNKETEEFIGDIGFKGKPNDERVVEIGYGLIPSAHGNGYATEAVAELVNWAFSSGVTTVIAECHIDNMASIRVLEKLGMKKINAESDMVYWRLHSVI